MRSAAERVETIVVGGGQAGLSVGYELARRGLPFMILEAGDRIGDAWRTRWDSLRLFTPARYDALAGMPFPAPRHSYPSKDEMADYLEAYAARFDLPVRLGVRVDRVSRNGTGFVVASRERRFEADNVVVSIGSWQRPRVPPLAAELDPDVVQLHSGSYRNPGQLQDGDVLLVGAGNSGAEIALDVAGGRRVFLSGRDVGHVPIRIDSFSARFILPLILRGLFHRVMTVRTPMGRKKRPEVFAHGLPLVRTKPDDLAAAGVERVPRVAGVQTVCLSSRTAACSTWPTSSGAPDSIPTSTGSISRASPTTTRSPSAASSQTSPGCTSSACCSCTRCRRR